MQKQIHRSLQGSNVRGSSAQIAAEGAALEHQVSQRVVRCMAWLCLCVLVPSPATAQAAPETVTQTIERQETAYSQTFVTGDTAAANRLLAADFTGLDSKGHPYDRTSIVADIARTPHQTSAHIDSIVVRVHGDVAVALGTETDTGPGKDEIDHRIWLDTWIRTVDGWKLIASSEMTALQK